MNRRSLLATLAVGGSISLSGCSRQTNFTTEPTGLTETTRTNLNYQLSTYAPYQAEQEVNIGPVTQTGRILLHVAFYESENTSIENTSGVGFITLPTATIAGKSLNPLSSADPKDIVSLFAQTTSQFDAKEIEIVETYPQYFSLIDSESEVTVMRTQINTASSIVEVYLRIHVATVQIADNTEVYALGFCIEGQEQARETIQTAFEEAVNPSEELQNQDVEPRQLQELISGSAVSK